MRPAQAWKALGLKPGSDRRAVKRAYAEKLKAIDPDKDVQTFLKLRDALAVAQADAEWRAHREAQGTQDEPEPEEEWNFVSDLPEIDPGLDDIPTPPRPGEPDEHDWPDQAQPEALPPELADRYRLEQLLYGEQEEGIEGELVSTFERILADPALEQLDAASRAEDWLASLLVHSIPRSDPLIPRAVAFFRWDHELGAAHQRYYVSVLAQRAEDLRCIAALEDPGHQWHHQFMLLRGAAPDKLAVKDRIQHRGMVAQMLASLRWHNPAVEREFDPAHVALWDQAIGKGQEVEAAAAVDGKPSWFIFLAIGWFLFSIMRFALPDTPAGEPLPDPSPFSVVPDDTYSAAPAPMPRPVFAAPPAFAPAPRSGQAEKLPPNIQKCVDEGGSLRITPTQYICTFPPPVPRPTLLPDPDPFRPLDRTLSPGDLSPVAPRPASDAADPDAVAAALAKKAADCIGGGSGRADCEQTRNPPPPEP